MRLNSLMSSQAAVIEAFKTRSFEEARRKAIKILSEDLTVVGYLVPIGSWVEADSDVINSISQWRARDMKNFLVQFDSSFEKTKAYLMNNSIKEPGRLLFLIIDQSDNLIGHVGLSNVNSKSAELDNLMRGVAGGPKDLMELAEKTVIDFAFENLTIDFVSLRVLSFNFLAISIHQRLGFVVSEREHLKKRIVGDQILHDVVIKEESDVQFTCLIMTKCR